MKIITEETHINNIPVLSIYPEKGKSKPLIIYLHGYGSNKEQGINFGYKMAKSGFFFISFDCIDHGERKNNNFHYEKTKFESVYPSDSGLDTYIHMHEVIEQTQKDINIIIDNFQENSQINLEKVGLTGFSMGGFATFYNAAYNDSIKVAAPIAGKPLFKKAWKDIVLSTSTYDRWSDSINNLQVETEKRTEFMEKIDPYSEIFNFAPKPLLIINGDQDTDQPYLYSLELYKKLLPYYKKESEKLKLSMPFVDHRLTAGIINEVCAWFEKYL